jgi:hypothetical protein
MDTCPGSRTLSGLVAEDAGPDIVITRHARIRMAERGASEDTVRLAVTIGEREPARRGLFLHRLDVPFGGRWRGRRYGTMQVAALVAHEPGRLVVVTVYTFFFPPEPSP